MKKVTFIFLITILFISTAFSYNKTQVAGTSELRLVLSKFIQCYEQEELKELRKIYTGNITLFLPDRQFLPSAHRTAELRRPPDSEHHGPRGSKRACRSSSSERPCGPAIPGPCECRTRPPTGAWQSNVGRSGNRSAS